MKMNHHVQTVCHPGAGAATCRYLMMSADGWECAKLRSDLKPVLDQRVAAGAMHAQGDNCEGQTKEHLNADEGSR